MAIPIELAMTTKRQTSRRSDRAAHALPDPAWRQRFRRRLRAWYARSARDLPWRRGRDPYGVWISEIMLQQTQVATVKPYFARFLQVFPTLGDLARADPQQVLRLWEGLGYYRRARQLHAAAQLIVQRHGGEFPRDLEAVRRLPGIGRYTAGAIASIAFDARTPILEANTVRVFSRLLAYPGDPHSAGGQQVLWAMAEAVLPRRAVGEFNQALMELGSQVCTVQGPRCGDCPAAMLCAARTQHLQESIPRAKIKRPPQPRHEVAVIIRRRGRVLLRQCPDGQRWAGLWDFPRFPVQAAGGAALLREISQSAERLTGVAIRPSRRLATLKHSVTRFRITLDCYEADCLSPEAARADSSATAALRWLRPVELEAYPLSTTGRKLVRLLRLQKKKKR